MPTLAYGNDFLEAYARLPKAKQKKVREFTEKFQTDPKSSAINYEKIHLAKDDKVRTVRIDKQYRAVILHPQKGDVHVLVWVDNHNEAMDWARNKVFPVNPKTGALQVVNLTEVEKVIGRKTKKQATLLDKFDDRTLLSFGIPEVLLPAIRAVTTPDQLLALNKHLPDEAAEALTWLAEGIPVDEVKAAISKPFKEIDTSDLATALENPDSKRRFVTVKSQDDLARILDAPLEKWRIFLHPSQKELVEKHFNGPARVLGLAGTGKTVVAMHRARHLAKDVFNGPADRILVTTFTGNLAHNLEQNVEALCGDEFQRIEVVHLHSWAARFMRDHGTAFEIANNDELQECWEEAVLSTEELAWDVGFLRQEWDQVVQANNVTSKAAYLKVARTGRGQTVNRAQRAHIWGIFEQFRKTLQARGKREWTDVIRETRQYIEKNPDALAYRAVVVDEAQDFHPEEWRLIRAIVPEGTNDLFVVGDAHQRIYGRKVTLGKCGVNVRGRSQKLKINYRTTDQIRSWAVAMLEGMEADDLDGGPDDQNDYRSLLSGPKPEIHCFDSTNEEHDFLAKRVGGLLEDYSPEEICIVARTTAMVKEYAGAMARLKTANVVLGKNADEKAPGVRLATMHRVKGLEFPCMIVAGCSAGRVPIRLRTGASDPVAKEEHETRERSLLFVAATRARDRLLVSCSGKPSPFVAKLIDGKQ